MLSSQLRHILTVTLKNNAESIIGRELKDYEIVNFYNLHEEQLEIIFHKTKHELQMFINEFLESMKWKY